VPSKVRRIVLHKSDLAKALSCPTTLHYTYKGGSKRAMEDIVDDKKPIDCFSLGDMGVKMSRADKSTVLRVVALEQLNTKRRVILMDLKRGAASILVAYRIYKDKRSAVRIELPDRQLNTVRALLMQNQYEPMLLDVPKAFSFFKERKDVDIIEGGDNSRFYEIFN